MNAKTSSLLALLLPKLKIALIVFFSCALFAHQFANADEAEKASLSNILLSIDQPQNSFRKLDPAVVAKSKSDLQAAITAVENFLKNQPQADSWYRYLNLNGIKTEIEKAKPSSAVIQRTILLLTRNQKDVNQALSLPKFIRLHKALTDFRNRSVYSSLPNAEALHKRNLTILKDNVKKQIENPSAEFESLIGRYAGILDDSGQATELVKKIRALYSKPNFYLFISDQFINEAGFVDINNVSDVNEMILGTLQRGTALTDGKILVNIVPNARQAQFKIQLEGITTSRAIGTRNVPVFGGIEIHSTGRTRVRGEASLFLDQYNLSASAASAVCQTRTNINGVCSSTLIRAFAKSEIHKQAPKAEYIASRRAEVKIRRQIDEQIGQIVNNANANLAKLQEFFLRTNSVPREFGISTTDKHLQVEIADYGQYQISTVSPPPSVLFDAGIIVKVHETMLNNFLEREMSSLKLNSEQLEKLTGEPPKDGKKFNLQFHSRRPVEVNFAKDSTTVTLRLRSLEQSGNVSPRAFSVSTKYEYKTEKLTRTSAPKIDFLGTKVESIAETGWKGNAEPAFEDLFPKEIDLTNIELPENLKNASDVKIKDIQILNGWLLLGADAKIIRK